MRILLPPSEGKTPPPDGPPLDLAALSLPELTPTRQRVAAALVKLARGPAAKARTVLAISPRQSEELARDAALLTEPCAPARSVYTGVLFEALDLPGMPAAVRRRADRAVLISSALLGMVSPADAIPAYRLSGDTTLPGVGTMASVWRAPLAEALAAPLGRGLVVDLRSGAYAAHFAPDEADAHRWVTVRVLQERRVGREVKRTVVSHHNKATKGRLVRALLDAGAKPGTPSALASACRDLGFHVEEGVPARSGVRSLDVVVSEL